MSDTDSFIDEVTEEVRRDRLFLMIRRYGWIVALVVVAIVGGASYNEYRKAQAVSAARQLGDEITAALAQDDPAARAERLAAVATETPGASAVLGFLTAAAQADAGRTDAAVASLQDIATDAELPEIYRQIATFKALTLQADTMPAQERRQQFQALARPGAPLRLLAEEQLALIDISEGLGEAAIERLQAILQDAEASTSLQQRAVQVIVALGGTPQTRPGPQG